MEVKIGKGLLSQIEKPFESSNNKITLDDLVKFLKETDEQYNHRVNTRRERYAKLLCEDGKIRDVIVVEAKKILNKEGFSLEGPGKPGVVSEYFKEYESPEVCEAMQVVCSAGYTIMMFGNVFEARKDRLRKEYEKNTKAPGSAENRIKEDSGVNPALKESASQFNDALLDEQAKKIAELTKDKELMKKATLSQLDDFIEIYNLLTKESQKTKRLGKEISKLNGIIHDKNEEIKRKTKGCCELVAENVDLKEGLRKTESLLQDVREANSRNLDTCFKNEDLIDELKKKLAEKTKLAKKYAKELSDSSLGLCKLEKQLEDKNAVLADVAEELRLSKIREKNLTEVSQKYMKENEELREKIAENAKLVKMIRNASKEYCDYGVAANEFIKELAGLYVLANNTRIINDEMLERCKNYQTYGFPANCNRETKKEINDIASGKTKEVVVDIAEEGGDHSAIIAQCCKNIAISKVEAEIIERCTKNGTELHYSEKNGFTYTNMYGEEMPIICLRGMCQVFTDEEIKNMKK